MPRNGSGVLSAPAGTLGAPNTTIASAKYNAFVNDWVADGNLARPITAGGTGATSVAGAQSALSLDNKVVYSAKSGAYTAVATDNNAFLRFTATATLSLTAAATLGANWHALVIADGGAVTIDPNGAELIEGASSLVVPDGAFVFVFCTGTAFRTSQIALPLTGGTLTGDVLFGLGTSGRWSKLQANGDLALTRANANGDGYVTWAPANTYFGWDGTRYVFGPAGGLAITAGNLILDTNVAITFSGTGAATTVTNLGFTATGSAPMYVARAWVNFNGTGTVAIRASGNVSSITDNGTGDYTINFTTAMADANYAVSATPSILSAGSGNTVSLGESEANPRTTGSVRIIARITTNNAVIDPTFINVAILR